MCCVYTVKTNETAVRVRNKLTCLKYVRSYRSFLPTMIGLRCVQIFRAGLVVALFLPDGSHLFPDFLQHIRKRWFSSEVHPFPRIGLDIVKFSFSAIVIPPEHCRGMWVTKRFSPPRRPVFAAAIVVSCPIHMRRVRYFRCQIQNVFIPVRTQHTHRGPVHQAISRM